MLFLRKNQAIVDLQIWIDFYEIRNISPIKYFYENLTQ